VFLEPTGLSFFKHLRLADFIGFPRCRFEKAKSSDIALIIPEYFLLLTTYFKYFRMYKRTNNV